MVQLCLGKLYRFPGLTGICEITAKTEKSFKNVKHSGNCGTIWNLRNHLENAKQNISKLTLSGKCVIFWKMRNKMSVNLLCLENDKQNENS